MKMSIIGELTSESFNKYMQYSEEEAEDAKYNITMKAMHDLCGEYTSLARLMVELEAEAFELKQDYDQLLEERKNDIMTEEGIKATPAKNKAKQELTLEHDAYTEKEKDIKLIKYQLRSLQYQIQYKIETTRQRRGEII